MNIGSHFATKPAPPQEIEQRQQRQAEDGEIVAFDAFEQMDAGAFDLVGADARQRRLAGHVEIIVEKAVGKGAHGELRGVGEFEQHRAVAHQRHAECSAWVLPRSACNCARAAARSAGLEKRVSPSASVWSAPSTSRPGMTAETASALARASRPPRRAHPRPRLAPPPRARRYAPAGSPAASPAPLRIFARTSLFEASTSGRLSSQSGTAHATGWRRRSVSNRITAAAVSSIERRVTSIDGQLFLAQSRREKATSSATAVLSIY